MKKLTTVACLFLLIAAGCSTGTPVPTVTLAPVAPTAGPTSPTTGAPAVTAAATPAPATAEPATDAPVATPLATASADSTTFTLVLADGPRAGTWEVTAPGGGVPTCQYLPDLDRWVATWLGPPPLSFVDVRGDADPFLLFTFSDEPDELGFLPTGDITFDVDDRGETATLHWISESHDADYIDSTGNHYGTVETGQAELTIECGSIFRYT